MTNRGKKRALALGLSLALLLGMLPTAALADEAPPPCANHQTHTADCGYIPAKEGQPCKHEQGQHDAGCGWMEGTAETPCDQGCAGLDEAGAVLHVDGCAYAPVVEGTPCKHMAENLHDDTCGYVETAGGAPCGHSCDLCVTQDSGAGPDTSDHSGPKLDSGPAPLSLPTPRAQSRAGEQTTLDISRGEIEITADGVSGKDTNGNDVTTHDPDGYIITQADPNTATTNTIWVTSGVHAITLSGVNIKANNYNCAFSIADGATANLTLSGENTLTSGLNRTGIAVPPGATLTITGRDADHLTVSGGGNSAGIGGKQDGSCGAVKISGGTVNATGGSGGAGIGGGCGNSRGTDGGGGGTIEITGGHVEAVGVSGGAGIGGGGSTYNKGGNGGEITITGGFVNATGTNGAGIGGGGAGNDNNGGSGGRITITGGRVEATSNGGGAGIGGGMGGTSFNRGGGSGGDITISGNAQVWAAVTSGNGSAGIGGATYNGASGTISIEDHAVVFAKSGTYSAEHIGDAGGYSNSVTRTQGVIFEDDKGTVYGSPTLPGNLTIPDGYTLTVPNGATLNVPNGTTLTIASGGTLINNGTIDNAGTITGGGTIDNTNGNITGTGSYTGTGTIAKATRTITLSGASVVGLDQVTLDAATPSAGAGDGSVEYGWAASDDGSAVGSWQAGTAFTSLRPETTYYFFAKVTGGTYYADAISDSVLITTGKPVYSVTVHGGTASPSSAVEGASVTIEAAVPSGQRFKAWTGLDGLTITEGSASTEKVIFTMPARAVEVTASVVSTYAITVSGGTASPASAAEGDAVTITAATPSGQRFTGWTITPDVTFIQGGNTTETATFTMPAQAVTATAGFETVYSGGGDDGPSYYSRTLTDKASGVQVKGRSIHESARLTVKAGGLHKTGDAGCDLLRAAQEAGHLLGAWDVSLSRSFRGDITVALPVEGRNGDTLTVAHCMDGKLTLSNVKVSGGFATAEADELSPFAVLDGTYTLADLEALADPGKDNPNTGGDNPFTDVAESDWFFNAVMYVYHGGIMQGTSATTFSPNDGTTRAQLAVILWRMEGSPAPTGGNPFSDVPEGTWYSQAVVWCAGAELVGGYGGGLFGPNDPISREQLAALLYRYAVYKGWDVSVGEDTNILSYADAFDVSEWAIPAVQWACGAGIMGGTTDNRLAPQQGATRAQIAAMLMRLLEKYAPGFTLPATGGTVTPNPSTGALNIPQTGDGTGAGWLMLALPVSAAGAAALSYQLRRKRREDEQPDPTHA